MLLGKCNLRATLSYLETEYYGSLFFYICIQTVERKLCMWLGLIAQFITNKQNKKINDVEILVQIHVHNSIAF